MITSSKRELNNKKLNMKKVNATILSLSLILNGYNLFFFRFVTIGYIFLVLLTISMLFISKFKINKKQAYALTLFIIILNMTFLSLINIPIFNRMFIIRDFAKLLFWTLFLSVLSLDNIDKEYFYKSVVIITFVSGIYLIIQSFFMNILRISLNNLFDFIIMVPVREKVIFGRPAGFFGEPGYFSNFALSGLALILFNKVNIKYKKTWIFIITVSVILSTSSKGLYLLLLLFFSKIMNKISVRKGIIFMVISLTIMSIVLVNINEIIELFNLPVEFRNMILKFQDLSLISRFGKSYSKLSLLKQNKYIGFGFGNEYQFIGEVEYLNSIARLIIQLGYIGFTIFIMFILTILKKSFNYFRLFFFISFLISIIFGNGMFTLNSIFLLSFIYLEFQNENIEGTVI